MKTRITATTWHNRTAKAVGGSLLLGSLVIGSAANAALTFTFSYAGNTPGVGFLDAGAGAARQAALETAGMRFSAMFGTFFDHTATIDLAVTSTDDALSSTLASAGSEYVFAPGFGAGEVVRTKIISNGATDLNGLGALDGTVDVNWGQPWELNPDTPAVDPDFDFFAALYHEFTHALGFSSVILYPSGEDLFGDGTAAGTGNPGSWAKFDQYLTDCGGTSLINAGTGLTNPGYVAAATTAVCFDSADAGSVKLYTPPQYSDGSSVSHLDGIGANATAMMKFDRDTGPEARVYNSDEVNILATIGYQRVVNNNVPEPGSVALVFAALAAAGLARRRKA